MTYTKVAQTAMPLYWDFCTRNDAFVIRLHDGGVPGETNFARIRDVLANHAKTGEVLPSDITVEQNAHGIDITFPVQPQENPAPHFRGAAAEHAIQSVMKRLQLPAVRSQSVQVIVNYVANLPGVRESRQPLQARRSFEAERSI